MSACPHGRYPEVETCAICEAEEERDAAREQLRHMEDVAYERLNLFTKALHTRANAANDKILALERENLWLKRQLSPVDGEGLEDGVVITTADRIKYTPITERQQERKRRLGLQCWQCKRVNHYEPGQMIRRGCDHCCTDWFTTADAVPTVVMGQSEEG